MDDDGVARLCAAAQAEIADARSQLLAAAAVEWQGSASQRFGQAVEDLTGELVRVARRLEHARALAGAAAAAAAVAAAAEAARAAAGAGGAGWR